MIIQEKMDIALDGWVITGVGIVNRYLYLVVGQWEDENKPYREDDGKKYDHPTSLYHINLKENTVRWKVIHNGITQVKCDGGRTETNLEAFFGGSGVTYHIDYRKDTFKHEDLLSTGKRIEEGTARGIRDIKLIGNHFYTGYSGNEIHRRDASKEWTLISTEAVEYADKFANANVRSLSAFSETEIYFCGQDGNLWYYDGKYCEKIFNMPKEIDFEFIECSDDAKVYAIDSAGRGVAVGRGKEFTFIPMKKDDPANGGILFDSCTFKGKVYTARYSIYEFRDDAWVKADIPGIYGGVEHLSAKDGVMFIGTPYSLKIYNGKDTFTLYGEEKEDAKLISSALFNASMELLEKGHEMLDNIEKK